MFHPGVPNETVQIIRATKDLIPPCQRHSAAISKHLPLLLQPTKTKSTIKADQPKNKDAHGQHNFLGVNIQLNYKTNLAYSMYHRLECFPTLSLDMRCVHLKIH